MSPQDFEAETIRLAEASRHLKLSDFPQGSMAQNVLMHMRLADAERFQRQTHKLADASHPQGFDPYVQTR